MTIPCKNCGGIETHYSFCAFGVTKPEAPVPTTCAEAIATFNAEQQSLLAGRSALDTQVGGDHYKKMGDYQPWEVLRHWLTPEEFRGYMKGTAIAYLAREQDKGKTQDIAKAMHTLQGFIELENKS